MGLQFPWLGYARYQAILDNHSRDCSPPLQDSLRANGRGARARDAFPLWPKRKQVFRWRTAHAATV